MNTEFNTSGPMPEPQIDQARIDRNWMAISTELFAPSPAGWSVCCDDSRSRDRSPG